MVEIPGCCLEGGPFVPTSPVCALGVGVLGVGSVRSVGATLSFGIEVFLVADHFDGVVTLLNVGTKW